MSRPRAPGEVHSSGVPYHQGAGYDDVQVRAAEKIRPYLNELQDQVISHILAKPRRAGITSLELAVAIDGNRDRLYTWAPRLTELKLAGVIVDSRRRRLDRIVWVLADLPRYVGENTPATRKKLRHSTRADFLELENKRLKREIATLRESYRKNLPLFAGSK